MRKKVKRGNFDGVKVTARLANCFANMGISSWEEASKFCELDFLSQSNLGKATLNEIKDNLRDRGLSLCSNYLRYAHETPEGKELYQDYMIAKLKWEIYRDKFKLEQKKN
jgi:DNA-directed RNA polymerase alpha subunit